MTKFKTTTKALKTTKEEAMAHNLVWLDGNYKAQAVSFDFNNVTVQPVYNKYSRKKWNTLADKFCEQDKFPTAVGLRFHESGATSIYGLAKDRCFIAEQQGMELNIRDAIHKARWTALFSGCNTYLVYTHDYSDKTEGVIKWCLTHGITVEVIDADNNYFVMNPVRDLTRSPWYQTWAVDAETAAYILAERARIEKDMWDAVEEALEPWKNGKWLFKTEEAKTKIHWSQFFELQETQQQWHYAGNGTGLLELPAGYACHEDFINVWGPAYGLGTVRKEPETTYLTYQEYIPGRNADAKPRYIGNGDWKDYNDNPDFPVRSFINKKQVQAMAKQASTPAEIFTKYCELCWFLTQPNASEYMDTEYVLCNSCGRPFHRESADPCVKEGYCPHCGQQHGHEDLLDVDYKDFLI